MNTIEKATSKSSEEQQKDQTITDLRILQREIESKYKVHGIESSGANAILMIKQIINNLTYADSFASSSDNALSSLERHINAPKKFAFPDLNNGSELSQTFSFGEPTEEFK